MSDILKMELWVGDIIHINSPLNEILNDKTFLIVYIDKLNMQLINTDTLSKIRIPISEEGIIGDGNMKRISILSRCDSPSYAIQNGLIPEKWIDIHFDGEIPAILTGKITNLENDMIEISTIEKETIYLNFDYKGIPEDLPIKHIIIREEPEQLIPVVEEEEQLIPVVEEEEEELEPSKKEEEKLVPVVEEEEKLVPVVETKITKKPMVENTKEKLNKTIFHADQIHFDDEFLGPIVQFVDVSTTKQRYSLETQVSDLLDDLLSTIPTFQRTPRILNEIHIEIERFKQLRETFSYFDQYGNVESAIIKGANYKPMILNYFENLNINLYWILPVVKNMKKIYDSEILEDETNNDVIPLSLYESLEEMKSIIQEYSSNNLPTEQNMYAELYTKLNPFFTPFEYVDDEDKSILINKPAIININSIVDNFQIMESSVFNSNTIKNKLFVSQKYNNSLTKLETDANLVTKRVNITSDDTLSIIKFLTLPEPVIRFSKINLPGTSLLEKACLNLTFLNYWQLLRQKTIIHTKSIDSDILSSEDDFASSIKEYVLNLSNQQTQEMTKSEMYLLLANNIVPKTKVLFNLMKKYIIGKLSIVDVVSYLEPFLIYTDDLTYMQYVDITSFIDTKISENNKKFNEKRSLYKRLNNKTNLVAKNEYSIVKLINPEYQYQVFNEGYNLINTNIFTNLELLQKITIHDYLKLYTATISLQSIPLMYPSEYSVLFEREKIKLNDKKEKNEDENCQNVVIAKFYKSLEALEADNHTTIYFDKKYDNTNYDVLEEKDGYELQVLTMMPEELREYIIKNLIDKKKMSSEEAIYLAETLLNGHKQVLNGQYAILYKGYQEQIENEMEYYIRQDNKWVLDINLNKQGINTDDSNLICNLQKQCVNVSENCMSLETDELGLQTNLLKDVINEFDSKYKLSKDELNAQITHRFEYFVSIVHRLTKIENLLFFKYNNEKYKISLFSDEAVTIRPISPYAQILNIVLGQKDFVKIQHDTIKFCKLFTRKAVAGLGPLNEFETDHWLYCNKTNVPLLPVFKLELAEVYTMYGPYLYQEAISIVKKNIGKQSDDGDWWCDKFSGWSIDRTDFDNEEGYQEGFKVATRAVMEEDAGNKIISALITEPVVKYVTDETIMINKVVNALSFAMGISIENQKEYIINVVAYSIRTTVPSERDYKLDQKEKAEKQKKTISYEEYYHTSLLYYTLAAFLIAIQTSIPSIKTRKTHPGCIRSFMGYPFYGAGDNSSVEYVACVVYDIRDSGKPWSVLKRKKKEDIIKYIKRSVDSLLDNIDTQRKIAEKTEYLLTNPVDNIAEEHSIAKWEQFLPPLINFKIKHLANITDDFIQSLKKNIKSGFNFQSEQILIVQSKMILFSLGIIEKIQNVVKKHAVLLHTVNNEPYLENSCCESKESESTIDYFFHQDSSIREYNIIVKNLSNFMKDIIIPISKAGIFFSKINTKNQYPPINLQFTEKTIYMAFIYFCKFKSLIPIPEMLIPFCTNKPDGIINTSESIDSIIRKLKAEGRNYTELQFLRLLQVVSREHTIPIDLKQPGFTPLSKFSVLLQTIRDIDDNVSQKQMILKIMPAIDTFKKASEDYTKEIKDLNNFLSKNIEDIQKQILDFIKRNTQITIRSTKFKNIAKIITKLSDWADDEKTPRHENANISDNNLYKSINFYKVFVNNFVNVFPNIILNKVNYTKVHIPKYYGFSTNHMNKIQKSISDYYSIFKPFYDKNTLSKILVGIQSISKNLLLIVKNTPSFTNIQIEDKTIRNVFDERTSKLLFEYYLLKVFMNYIELCDNEKMIFHEGELDENSDNEDQDIVATDYLEDVETKSNFGVRGNIHIVEGNKTKLRQEMANLLVAYIEILSKEKETIDISYDEIQDRAFKLKEKEKDMFTDRLKQMNQEERDADTILKVNKLEMYSKGLQKGLIVLDKEFYDKEQEFRDKMSQAERNIRKSNKDATDENIDMLLDDYFEEEQANKEIDEEAYDMSYMGETYYDGNTDGVGSPEEEGEEYDSS
jgi:hypothetical protein